MLYELQWIDANEVGLRESIILRYIAGWTCKNKNQGKNYHEDRTWFYHTYHDFAKFLPGFTARQVRYYIQKLIKKGKLMVRRPTDNKEGLLYAFVEEESFFRYVKYKLSTTVTKLSRSFKNTIYNIKRIKKRIFKNKNCSFSEQIRTKDPNYAPARSKKPFPELPDWKPLSETGKKNLDTIRDTLRKSALGRHHEPDSALQPEER